MISRLLKKNEKGFTLMEMLIVVAIIAVLIAIAIPTFNASLNKARVATDEANIRSGYASVMATVLTDELGKENDGAAQNPQNTKEFTLKLDGSVDAAGTAYATKGKNTDSELKIAGVDVGGWDKGATVKYTYHYETSKIDITVE